MKRIIIAAADENFSPLLNDLLDSLHQFPQPVTDAIGVLDLGLSADSLNMISSKADHIVQPGWDLYVREDIKASKPFLRANTSRPFLPRHFPGYDLYLWLDADTWLQDRFAVDWLFQAASQGQMALVPETDRCYRPRIGFNNWRIQRLESFFSCDAAQLLQSKMYYNSGAFALHRDTVHWDKWAECFDAGLRRDTDITSDQTAMNYAIWSADLPVHPLPALCNWCCHMAYPVFHNASASLCEPFLPHRRIGLVHMTDTSMDARLRVSVDGKPVESGLRYSDLKKIRAMRG